MPLGTLKWMLSTKGALPEVLPWVILKEVTRNGADTPVAMVFPMGSLTV